MPFVAARLPILHAFHIRERRQPPGRIDGVLLEQARHLGHRGVLELVQARGDEVVDRVGGLLCGEAHEPFENQHAVRQLAFVGDFALVREQIVAQVDAVGEAVAQHFDGARRRDLVRHFGVHRVLDQIRRPWRAADLPPHLDVFDRVGDPAFVDVGELPQRFVEQVSCAFREPAPPVRRPVRHGPVPQIGQSEFDGILGRLGDFAFDRHERGHPVEVGLRPRDVAGALEEFDEMVVEVEHPDVPVGDQVQFGRTGVGVRVCAEQRVVVRVEVLLAPDHRAVLRDVDHVHRPRPGLAVLARAVEVRVQPRGIGQVELGEDERLLVHAVLAFPVWGRAFAALVRQPNPRPARQEVQRGCTRTGRPFPPGGPFAGTVRACCLIRRRPGGRGSTGGWKVFFL